MTTIFMLVPFVLTATFKPPPFATTGWLSGLWQTATFLSNSLILLQAVASRNSGWLPGLRAVRHSGAPLKFVPQVLFCGDSTSAAALVYSRNTNDSCRYSRTTESV